MKRSPKHRAPPTIVAAIGGKRQHVADHHHGRTGQRRDRIQIGAQDGRDLGESTSRTMPPPMPVSMPSSAAITGLSP